MKGLDGGTFGHDRWTLANFLPKPPALKLIGKGFMALRAEGV
jgi:hypothetical protein